MQPAFSAYQQVSDAVRRAAAERMSRVWRYGTEAVLIRATVLLALGAVAARLHAAHDPGVVCPLRLLTGIPCPFCGSTSAVMDLGTGDLATAVRIQPLTVLAAGVLVTAPTGWYRRWAYVRYRHRIALLLGAVALSWIYQIVRLGIIG